MWTRETAGALLLAVPFALGLSAASGSGVEPDVLFSFADPEIVESSGLVATDGLVVTVNDSGDAARAFVVDPGSGETVGVTRWDPGTDDGRPDDVEALAPGPDGTVWVGDIGDNGASRDSIQVVRVPVGRGELWGSEPVIDLVYPDGARDAETLLSHPVTGRLFVVSKSVFGGTVYAAPPRLDPAAPNRMRAIGPVIGIATDGAFFPDGRHLIVRSYTGATVYTFPQLAEVGSMDLPDQEQGEGIAVDRRGRVLLSSEGLAAPVLELRLPAGVRKAVAEPTEEPSAEPSAGASGRQEAADVDADGDDADGDDDASEGEGVSEDVWAWLALAGGFAGLGLIVWLAGRLRRR
ncbi:hypothetical protein [Nocardioides pacificus]